MDYYGYAGKNLFVDLSDGSIEEKPLDMDTAKKFVGGPGMGFKLLHEKLEPGTEPLSPENPLVIGLGPLGGTLVPGSGKCYLVTKYPILASKEEEKYFVSYSMGGSRRFGAMMKNSGYDNIVITGQAENPCYLKVTDDEVEILNAEDVWGKDIHQATETLVKKHEGKTGKPGVWTMGQAGENLVKIAQATLDNLNSLGRDVGALMGTKNLKAVVTLGEKGIKVNDKKRFLEVLKEKREEILNDPDYQTEPTLHRPAVDQVLESNMKTIRACTSCMGACRATVGIDEGEYEGVTLQGGDPTVPIDYMKRLRLDDIGAMYKLMDKMNRVGLGHLTTIRMIYFVTRMYEQGAVTKSDTGGLELEIGDLDSYLKLVEKIVKKEDIGAFMSKGWYALSEEIGVEASKDFKMGASITKGVDTLVDARLWPSNFGPSMGISHVVHSKGKHSHSDTYWPKGVMSVEDIKLDTKRMGLTDEEIDRIFTDDSFNQGRLAKHAHDAEYLYNCLGICDCVVHWTFDQIRDVPWLSKIYSALTGIEVSPREFLRAGERCFNLEKALNVREGFTRKDDKIPSLWVKNTEKTLADNYLKDWFGNRLEKEDIEKMLDDYYRERGWDVEKGVPKEEKLKELGLNNL